MADEAEPLAAADAAEAAPAEAASEGDVPDAGVAPEAGIEGEAAAADGEAAAADGEAPAEAGEGGEDGEDGEVNVVEEEEPSAKGPEVNQSPDAFPVQHVLTINCLKHNSMHYLADDCLLMLSGTTAILHHTTTLQQQYLPSLDGGGIGAVAVHPSRKYFALAEKTMARSGPNIYIYSYPELQVYKKLKGGTERAYAALAFNDAGDLLASVGGYPDFMLSLWNWESEGIILRCKAFSQDVYTVKFSPYFEGNLTTSGTGHIRFWKMASTFTGLKLQGAIGKFGNVELSDVVGFVEMPDGKVLSGTETGELLMWDAGLIKVMLLNKNHKPCHAGAVEVLIHDKPAGVIITAGADGYVRLWDFNQVNDAEAEGEGHTLCIKPVAEVQVAPDCFITTLVRGNGEWTAMDKHGRIYRVHLPKTSMLDTSGYKVELLADYHAGAIVTLNTMPDAHLAVTAGADGSVRCYDYANADVHATQIFSRRFNTPITSACYLPKIKDEAQRFMIVGFADGMVRVVMRCADDFKLVSVFKPHKSPVVAMAANGKQLATIAKDGTVFFFKNTTPSTFTPIAYTSITGRPSCCAWDSRGKALLVGCLTGELIELEAPVEVDTSKTFELPDLPRREFQFRMLKPPKPKKEKKKKKKGGEGEGGEDGEGGEAEAAPAQGEGEGEAPAAEGEAAAEGGEDGEQEAEEEEEEEAEPEPELEDPLEPYPVYTLRLKPGDPSRFICTFGGAASGRVFEWSPDNVFPSVYCTSFQRTWGMRDEPPTTFFSHSHSGAYTLHGSIEGRIRVQEVAPNEPFHPPAPATEGGTQPWQRAFHDMQTGRVTGVAMSFDDAYLVTAGYDGSLYVMQNKLGTTLPVDPSAAPLPSVAAEPTPAVEDVTGSGYYSIEEAKQKAEQDALLEAAEMKKLTVREQLKVIRDEFEKLLADNMARPEGERLTRSAFEIDPGLRELIEQQNKTRENVARLELARDSDRQQLGLAKLREFLLEDLEVEHIELFAFKDDKHVCSFRTTKLRQNLKDEMEKMQMEGVGGGPAARMGHNAAKKEATTTDAAAADQPAVPRPPVRTFPPPPVPSDPNETKYQQKMETKRRRAAEWATFNSTKPTDARENEQDVAAITDAANTVGDYKLKSDNTHVLPEDQRMTPARKRLQILTLIQESYDTKMAFNKKFMALRDAKRAAVAEIRKRNARLKEIAAKLNEPEPLYEPEMALVEEPESREHVKDSDVAKLVEEKKAASDKKAGGGGGLGGFAGGGGGGAKPAAAPAGAKPAAATTGAAKAADHAVAAPATLSELEMRELAYSQRKLAVERANLKREIDSITAEFDEQLAKLQREQLRVQADVKLADVKLIVMDQELTMLKECEKRELALQAKLEAKLDDRDALTSQVENTDDHIESKRSELDAVASKRGNVVSEFDELVPAKDIFREQLSKIFYKKIKRLKKKVGGGESEDEDDDEDDDDMDMDEDEEEDEEAGGEEACPTGCDQATYEKVCDLRERRLDEEDAAAEVQKVLDGLKRERELLLKKQKMIEQSLTAINTEILDYQKEKQSRLNTLDIALVVQLHQVQYLVADGRLPDDVAAGLLFNQTTLERLQGRISELDDDRRALRAAFRELHAEHLQLQQDKRAKQQHLAALQARCRDVQLLRFGQVIDLNLLDTIGAKTGTEDLRAELLRIERQQAQEVAAIEEQLTALKSQLIEVTRTNTAALNSVTDINRKGRTLQLTLADTQKGMFVDPIAQKKVETAERDRLVAMINEQSREIDGLRQRVAAMRRKDVPLSAFTGPQA